MTKFKQLIGERRAILVSVLCLLSFVFLAPSAQAVQPVATISDVKAQQRYPWNGKVDIEYTVSGLTAAAEAKGISPYLTVMAIDRDATPWTTNVADLACLSIGPAGTEAFTDAAATADGTHQLVWNLDKQQLKLVSTNVIFAVTGDDCVQLWKDGPFWSQCNVGAAQPQDGGYFFWWGDTVGYTNSSANVWCAVDGSSTGFKFNTANASIVTKGKTADELKQAGYIDDAGNLVAAHDAATAHCGAPWRMPTLAEIFALTNSVLHDAKGERAAGYLKATWTNDWNGSSMTGRVVFGQGAYFGRRIFLPAGGKGATSSRTYFGSDGVFWSSTPTAGGNNQSMSLTIGQDNFDASFNTARYNGKSVRPVRGSAVLPEGAGTFCGGVSEPVRVDQTSGTRTAQATETIVYSPLWAAGPGAQPTAMVCVNETGQELVTASTDSGTYAWTPTVPGTFTLQHETWQGGTLMDILTATFEVLAEVTVADVTGATYVAYTNDAPATVPFVVSAETPIKVVYTADEGKMFPGGYRTFETNLTADAAAITVAVPADQQPVAAAACEACLTFSGDASFGIKMRKEGTPAEPKLECSQDQIYWSKFDLGNGAAAGADNKLYLRGTGNTQFSKGIGICYAFTNTADSAAAAIACSGNIMTLLDYETVANGQEPTMGENAFVQLFDRFAALTTAPELPATNLADQCYGYMFRNCTALTTAPALPATNLTRFCYNFMFKNCASLTTAPALPATKPVTACYSDMFSGCTSLTVAPALPATTLAEDCYKNMFSGCTSLTAAPELSAMNLTNTCYMGMFNGCTALTDVPTLPATNVAKKCYALMFKGCTSLEVNTNGTGKAWSIPSDAAVSAATVTQWNTGMFKETAGDITNTVVTPGVTYYVKSAIKRVTVVVPEVEGATADLFAFNVNGGWLPVETNAVPSNATVRVLWTADAGKGLTGAGAASAYQWQAELVADKAMQEAPAPTVGEAGASEVTIALDTRAKKSYFDAKDILPVWYAKDAEVKAKGEGQQSWETLVKSSATDDTFSWTPAAPDTYTLSQVGLENATIFFTLPVEVTTNGLELAGTTFAVTDESGEPLEPMAAYDGKLIVASNSTVKVTYTVTTPGVYFADGSTICTVPFTADKSVNDAATAIAGQKPAAPAKPSVMLGVVAQRYPWNRWADVNWKVTNWPNSRKNFKVEIKCGTTVVTKTISLPDGVQGEYTGSTGMNMKINAPKDFVGEAEFSVIDE